MSLSVVCVTNDPGPRVAAIMRQFRPVATEIIIGADSRVDQRDLSEYADVADRLFRVEFVGLHQCMTWIHRQASTDWCFLVAGDELPSPALIEQLPELMADRSVSQYSFLFRWLYRDRDHWLDEYPWNPNYTNRLVRNDGSLYFSGIGHTAADNIHPNRLVADAPMYHLDTVLTSPEKRLSKVRQYEEMRPGLRLGEQSFNEVFYVPEIHSQLDPASVPQVDRAAIAEVLDTGYLAEQQVDLDSVPFVTAEEMSGVWSEREVIASDHRVDVERFERDSRIDPGEQRQLCIRITNRGRFELPATFQRRPQVTINYRWLTETGEIVEENTPPSQLSETVRPSQTAVVPITIAAPRDRGEYLLEIVVSVAGIRVSDPLQIPVNVASRKLRELDTPVGSHSATAT